MSKIVIIGAGKTGRGFIGRLLREADEEILFIDKNAELVEALNTAGRFKIRFFGNKREAFTVDRYRACTWESADLENVELILVSVGGQNLKDVGEQLAKLLQDDKHYYIITAGNASHPSKTLREAIGKENVSVSESTVFCTTIEDGGLDINSENYPYLQCDADLLDGYVPGAHTLKTIGNFSNFLTIKLFTYNAASCVIAYLGKQKGYSNYADAANDPVILPKGCAYAWSCQEPGECIQIEFDADGKDMPITAFEISDNSTIVNAFSKIEKSFNKQKPYYQLECYVQLYGILLFLAESTAKEPTHSKKRELLHPAVKYITENYFDSSITNDSLSGLCRISTVYFRKTFEFVYGVSPIKYLHNFRINKAKAILLSDYESIEQVALSVGYNSIYHFSKMFKEYTGKSPTEYAGQNKSKKT